MKIVTVFVSSLLYLGCFGIFHYYSKVRFVDYFSYSPDTGLTFQVRVCRDAYFGLFRQEDNDNEPNLIVVGAVGYEYESKYYYGFKNTTRGPLNPYKLAAESPVSCTEFRPFWIQTTSTSISMGNGQEIGQSEVLKYNHSIGRPNKISFLNPINRDNYQPAEWIFDHVGMVTAQWTKQREDSQQTTSSQNEIVISRNETVKAHSKIRCAALCTETVWCRHFLYSRENQTCFKASEENQENNIYFLKQTGYD